MEKEKIASWSDAIRLAWFFIDRDKKKFVLLTIVLTIINFYYLVPPYILGQSVDFFTKYRQGDDLTYFYFLCATIAISVSIVAIFRQLFQGSISKLAVNARYRTKVLGFDRLIELSLKWHQQENTGNKVQRILTGSKAVENLIMKFSRNVMILLVTFTGTAITTFFVNPFFLVYFTIYVILMVTVEIFFDRKINVLLHQYNKDQESASGTFIESASNMLAIKALGAKDSLSKKVIEKESAAKEVTHKKIRISNYKWIIFQTINGLSWAFMLYMTGMEVVRGNITSGTILVYGLYFNNLRDRVQDFAESINDLLEIRSDIGRIIPIFESDNHVKEGTKLFPKKWSKIAFEKINFKYNDDQTPVLNNFSLQIKKGQTIGIAGHSGSGKSTLVKILLGLYEVQTGKINFGSTDLYEISHTELTNNIAIVLQETELFNLSLLENITMMREVDPQTIQKAIEIACLGEVIQKIPQGIKTLIGERGYALSGGERQRVGIARAICKNAQILLLDEATSSLDSTTESLIMKNIYKQLSKNTTIILIAHRVSTLTGADTIIVMEQGQIIEEGTFGELTKIENGKFSELYRIQSSTTN